MERVPLDEGLDAGIQMSAQGAAALLSDAQRVTANTLGVAQQGGDMAALAPMAAPTSSSRTTAPLPYVSNETSVLRAVLSAVPEAHRARAEQLLGDLFVVRSDDLGSSPLHLAVLRKNTETCRALLTANADPNKGSINKAPLHLAGETGQDDVVRMLLDARARIETKDRHGCTPLHLASTEGHTNIVDMLLSKGANKDPREHEDNRTPLLMAAAKGHAGVVKALLDKGACHAASDQYGQSSLYVAAGADHADVLKQLIVTPQTLNLEP